MAEWNAAGPGRGNDDKRPLVLAEDLLLARNVMFGIPLAFGLRMRRWSSMFGEPFLNQYGSLRSARMLLLNCRFANAVEGQHICHFRSRYHGDQALGNGWGCHSLRRIRSRFSIPSCYSREGMSRCVRERAELDPRCRDYLSAGVKNLGLSVIRC